MSADAIMIDATALACVPLLKPKNHWIARAKTALARRFCPGNPDFSVANPPPAGFATEKSGLPGQKRRSRAVFARAIQIFQSQTRREAGLRPKNPARRICMRLPQENPWVLESFPVPRGGCGLSRTVHDPQALVAGVEVAEGLWGVFGGVVFFVAERRKIPRPQTPPKAPPPPPHQQARFAARIRTLINRSPPGRQSAPDGPAAAGCPGSPTPLDFLAAHFAPRNARPKNQEGWETRGSLRLLDQQGQTACRSSKKARGTDSNVVASPPASSRTIRMLEG